MNKENKKMYQVVYITDTSGTTHKFIGPAAFFKGNDNGRIENIKFSEPRELPKDCYFGPLE